MYVYHLGMKTPKPIRRVADIPKEQKSKATMHLPSDLWKEAKIEAIKRGIDAQDIVAEGLRLYFKKGSAK